MAKQFYTALLILLLPLTLFPQSTNQISEIGHFQKASAFSFNEAKAFFILDKGSNEIIKLDSTGVLLKKIGGTGWDEYTFDSPADICVTMLKVYIADRNNNRIQAYDKDLNFLFSLDPKNFTLAKSVFKYPVSSHASPYGDIYIADSDNKQILKFNSNWEYVNTFGNYEYGKFAVANPVKLTSDSNGNIYLLDGKKIILFDQFGNGIAINTLPEKPNNIGIMNNILTAAYDNYVMFSAVNPAVPGIYKLGKIEFDIKGKIVDAIITAGKAYILTENSIFIFSIPPIEQSN